MDLIGEALTNQWTEVIIPMPQNNFSVRIDEIKLRLMYVVGTIVMFPALNIIKGAQVSNIA